MSAKRQEIYEHEGRCYITGAAIPKGTPGGSGRLYFMRGSIYFMRGSMPARDALDAEFYSDANWAIEVPGPAPDGFEYLPEEKRAVVAGEWFLGTAFGYPLGYRPMLSYADFPCGPRHILRKLDEPAVDLAAKGGDFTAAYVIVSPRDEAPKSEGDRLYEFFAKPLPRPVTDAMHKRLTAEPAREACACCRPAGAPVQFWDCPECGGDGLHSARKGDE